MHMWALTFSGKLECKHPSEFLDDVREIMKKHDAYYIGTINRFDLGEFVDFVEIKDVTSENEVVEEKENEQENKNTETTNTDISSGD